MDAKEKQSMLLMQLVMLFQSAALQQMGKLKNPISDKIERDLQQAQISIDMISMLYDKTKGNLTDEEEKMISSVLRDLRLNYVDEANKKPDQPPSDEAAGKDEAT